MYNIRARASVRVFFYSFGFILLGLNIDVREIVRTICNSNNNNSNSNNIINNNSYIL